jgi:hypothetical protein
MLRVVAPVAASKAGFSRVPATVNATTPLRLPIEAIRRRVEEMRGVFGSCPRDQPVFNPLWKDFGVITFVVHVASAVVERSPATFRSATCRR